MATLITDPELEEKVRSQRAEWGGDRYDEVWEGTYMMTPFPNPEHAELQANLIAIFRSALGFANPAKIYTGVNISDRTEDWTTNYRGPDVSIVLPGGIARKCGAHFVGGPDFVVEVISPYDRGREKIPFYGKVGVRELLLIDRDPWALELYRLKDGQLEIAGRSTLERPDVLPSAVLPVKLRLVPGEARPGIEVAHNGGIQKWVA